MLQVSYVHERGAGKAATAETVLNEISDEEEDNVPLKGAPSKPIRKKSKSLVDNILAAALHKLFPDKHPKPAPMGGTISTISTPAAEAVKRTVQEAGSVSKAKQTMEEDWEFWDTLLSDKGEDDSDGTDADDADDASSADDDVSDGEDEDDLNHAPLCFVWC